MSTLLKKILRDLQLRPLRNALTLFGVILGVAGVVCIALTTRTIVESQRLTYDASNQADMVAFGNQLSQRTVSLVERQDNVVAAETRTVTLTRFTDGTEWIPMRLIGVNAFADIKLDVVDLVRGQYPAEDQIVFDESTLELADLAIGDTVAVQRTAAEEPVYLTVSGFTRSPAVLGAGISNQAIAYTEARTVRSMRSLTADNFLLMRFENRQLADQTSRDVTALLSKRGIVLQDMTVRDPGAFIGSRELSTLLLLLQVFSVLGAVLASILVANTISAVMSEETTQIGIARSVGARRWQIVGMYLVYALVLGLTGAAIGFIIGMLAGRQLSSYLATIAGLKVPPLGYQPREIGLALLVGILVTSIATAVPAIRSARQQIAPLLRSPGVRTSFRSHLLQALTSWLARFNPSAAMGVRNASRRPARSLMTIGVVAVAVAAYVSTSALSGSVNGTVDELYELYGADGWVFYRSPVTDTFARDLARQPDVVDAENWTTAIGSIGLVSTDLWGMPERDPLYAYRLVEGTWIYKSNPPVVVLSKNLASQIEAGVGDEFSIDVGDSMHRVRVTGIVDDSSTYLGATTTGKVFLADRELQRMLGRVGSAGIFAVKLNDSSPEAVDEALAEIERATLQHGPGSLAAYKDQESANQAVGILTLLLNAMVLLVAVVGVAGIVNTLLINIHERRREIGVLRAIGGRTRHIVMVLASEGFAVALAGALVGILFGVPLAKLFVRLTGERLFELTFHLSALNLVIVLFIALLAVSSISTAPGLLAAQLRPLRALRYE